MWRRYKAWILAIAGLVAVGVTLKLYWHHAVPPAPPAPNVKVMEMHAVDLPITYEYPGKATSIAETEVRAQISGILLKKAYTEGQLVKPGDLLFEIDPSPFTAAANKAKAQLESARSNLWNAEQTWKRVSTLYKTKGVSTQERDDALSAHKAAKSAVEQAKADLQTAQINLGYTKITAPIAGITSQAPYSEGNLIEAGTTLLTKITQVDPIYISFAYPDSDWQHIQYLLNHGMLSQPDNGILSAEIREVKGGPVIAKGPIDFTDNHVDFNTASIAARATIVNLNSVLMPGQFVHVTVQDLLWKNAFVIPERALMQGAQEIVYVLDAKKTVAVRPVTLGPLTPQGQIITQGLLEGDLVVIDGMIKLRPGMPVNIVSTVQSNAAPAATAKDAGTP